MAANKIPTQEELQEDLAEFLRQKYGDHVQLGVQVHGQGERETEVEPPASEDHEELKRRILAFDMTPKEVKAPKAPKV